MFFILLLFIPLMGFSAEIDLQDQEWLYELKEGDTLEKIVRKTAGPHLKEEEVPSYIRKIKNRNLQIDNWNELKVGTELDLHIMKSTYKEVIFVESRDVPDYYMPSYRMELFYNISSSTLKETYDDFSIQGDKISLTNFGMSGSYATSHNPVHYRFSGTYIDLFYTDYQIRDYHLSVLDFNHFENLNFFYTYRHRILTFRSLDGQQNAVTKDNKLHFIGAGAQFYFYLFDRKVELESSANILLHSQNEEGERESFGSVVEFKGSYSPIDHFETEGFIDFLYLNGGDRIHRTLLVGINIKVYFEI